MKLELQHLAPYLPYKLQMKINSRVEWRPNYKERALLKGADATLTTALLDDIQEKVYDSLGKFIPILRPLSDLTREIEHNGKTFTPIEYLIEHYTGGGEGQELRFYEDGCYFYSYRKGIHCICNQGEMIQKLFEWHFDVFSLIKKGLAVDLNTHISNLKSKEI